MGVCSSYLFTYLPDGLLAVGSGWWTARALARRCGWRRISTRGHQLRASVARRAAWRRISTQNWWPCRSWPCLLVAVVVGFHYEVIGCELAWRGVRHGAGSLHRTGGRAVHVQVHCVRETRRPVVSATATVLYDKKRSVGVRCTLAPPGE